MSYARSPSFTFNVISRAVQRLDECLSKQLGRINYLDERGSVELLDLKKRLGFDDPRFHVENCDLCGNSAFRDGYKELPQPKAFEPAPHYTGYLARQKDGVKASSNGAADTEALVKAITDQVLAALGK